MSLDSARGAMANTSALALITIAPHANAAWPAQTRRVLVPAPIAGPTRTEPAAATPTAIVKVKEARLIAT